MASVNTSHCNDGEIIEPAFDERCFIIASIENLSTTAACRCAITYLSDDDMDAAFELIKHQIMSSICTDGWFS